MARALPNAKSARRRSSATARGLHCPLYLVHLHRLVARFSHLGTARSYYPAILNHERHGEEARKLFADAQQLLEQIVSDKLPYPRAVYGFFPANRVGDERRTLSTDECAQKLLLLFISFVNQIEKTEQPGKLLPGRLHRASRRRCPILSLQLPDHLGAFAVTSGTASLKLEKSNRITDDYNAIMAEAAGP